MPRRSSGRRAGRVSLAALAVATLTTAAPVPAQNLAADSAAVAPALSDAPTPAPAAPAGPTIASARAGATRAASAADSTTAAAPIPGPRAGRPVALMAVGAAALVLGLIIGGGGGKAVAIGGAVVGLVGLYDFIR